MFKFTHETQELNLIIASLEHKIRDMQTLLNKMVAEAQAQAPKPPQPIENIDGAPIATSAIVI